MLVDLVGWRGCMTRSMRAVWRGLFWAADGTWSVKNAQMKQVWSNRVASAKANLTDLAVHGTTPRQNPFLPISGASIATYVYNLVGSIPLSATSQLKKLVGAYFNETTPEVGSHAHAN